MDKFQKSVIKTRILNLARLRATGTPAEMAFRFDISLRTVKRMVNEIRAEGVSLVYDPHCSSYVLNGSRSPGLLNDGCKAASHDGPVYLNCLSDEY